MTVDEALAYARSETGKAWAADGYPEDRVIAVLAAEVNRLRATLTRIETFLDAPASSLGDGKLMVYVDELRRVMRVKE